MAKDEGQRPKDEGQTLKAEGRRAKAKWRMVALVLMVLAMPAWGYAQSSHLLIVVGLAGDPEHGELFNKWGASLASAATGKLNVPKEHVTLLTDAGATRDAVVKA